MKLRTSNIEKLGQGIYDALVLGGGINGAVSAAALSGKGARVALIDQRDFAGFTSQQSSNLAWGGIKYLESNDFGLVWGLCKSRNHLLENYPSRVKEIRFYSTIEKGFPLPSSLHLARHLAVLVFRARVYQNAALAAKTYRQYRRTRHPDQQFLRRIRVFRRLPARQRRTFRLPVHPFGDGPRLHRGELRRIAGRPP